jgi:outer membrane lipoprotein-sorting protein
MKKFILILFAINSFTLSAQVDQKAKTILDAVSEKTKSYNSITAGFEFIIENKEAGIRESNKGELILQGEKYKLAINGIEIFCDGETQWTYLPDAMEVNISEPNSDEEAINPASIFTIYGHGYKNTYLGEFTNELKKTWKIEMVPSEQNEFERIIIEIEQDTYKILNAKMSGNDGNTYIINVTSMETGKKYPASAFSFNTDDHPDVDIIDMR